MIGLTPESTAVMRWPDGPGSSCSRSMPRLWQTLAITSAGWGHRTGSNIAMGYVEPDYAERGTHLEVLMLGETFRATVCEPCLYDPTHERVRR